MGLGIRLTLNVLTTETSPCLVIIDIDGNVGQVEVKGGPQADL
jgi:hypothetical protein